MKKKRDTTTMSFEQDVDPGADEGSVVLNMNNYNTKNKQQP